MFTKFVHNNHIDASLTLYLLIYLIPFFLVGQVENSKWIVRDSF